ncbi:S41 family peptidase [Tundrisphaera sp. TA3]|uniref:S41 family peptidase n=1 Tax=Tundrisphaera sp. TA3 TaxID=3435775 RepID=UPI003EB6DF48
MRRSLLVALGWAFAPFGAAAAPADLAPPPADLARRAEAIADAVLSRQIDPPARQQMFLDGLRAVYLAAGVPHPADLARRASAIATPEPLAALLVEAWPRSSAVDLKAGALEDALLRGMLSGIPGASLLSDKELRVAEQIEGNLYVGVQIAIAYDVAEKRPVIAKVLEGGPADRAGARNDDRIEEIDGVSTLGIPLAETIDRLRGAEGTDVVVRLRGKASTEARTLTMTRGRLPRETVMGVRKRPDGGWAFRIDGPDAIGYLRLDSISGSTPQELRQVAPRLEAEGVRALILDLRGVSQPGLHPTVLLADSLLDGGTIGRVRTGDSVEAYEAEPDALFRDLPLAVIADRTTTGAAVWLCAALQDNHRAVVVGTPTGADTEVQSTVALPGGGWWLRMTTGRLERGDGRPLAGPTRRRSEMGRLSRFEPFDAQDGISPDLPIVHLGHGPIGRVDVASDDPRIDPFVAKALGRLARDLKPAGP